jgi:NitT/TauT family transport system permease protein
MNVNASPAPLTAAAPTPPSADHGSGFARRWLRDLGYPALTLLLAVIVWQAAVVGLQIPRYLLPAPSLVAETFGAKLPLLWEHTLATTAEVLAGFGLSILIGVPIAIMAVASPLFSRTVYPLIVASQAVPKMAIAPLLVVWFGFGTLPKVLVAFLIAFFPIVIDGAVGLRSVEREMLWLAQSMGLGPLATFFKIRLPHALPSLFGGLKVAVTLAVVGAVVGEFVGADAGLGHLLIIANGNLDTPTLFATLIILTALGLLLYGALALLERIFVPWHAPTDDQSHSGSA